MSLNERILQLVEKYEKEAVELRHYLHEHPEVSSQEFETSKMLKKYATDLGLEVEEVPVDDRAAGTGFIATLDTGTPGKTVGLRTDIDALPVQENPNNLVGSRSVISKNDGAMHACAHDGHMTTVIHSMKILHELKDELTGKVIFIFEEAEEIGNGIHSMIEFLKTKEIDAIYGNHLAAFLDTGYVSADIGPVMAAAAIVNFEVVGKGGHGSRPDLSVNPLFAGVDILNSISTAWNNQIDVEETVTLGITQFNVGSQFNVFADRAKIGGSLRYFDVETGEAAYEMLMNTAEKVASVHNCQIEVDKVQGPQTIPVINDEKLALLVQKGVDEIFPGVLTHDVNWFASETFSHYAKIAPTVFSFVGIRNEELGTGAEHHNEYFDMDDDALKYAIGMMTKFTIDYLSQ
jgi:amidohydrolase